MPACPALMPESWGRRAWELLLQQKEGTELSVLERGGGEGPGTLAGPYLKSTGQHAGSQPTVSPVRSSKSWLLPKGR